MSLKVTIIILFYLKSRFELYNADRNWCVVMADHMECRKDICASTRSIARSIARQAQVYSYTELQITASV